MRWSLAAIALCTLVIRAQVLSHFGFLYTGTDDTVIWNVAQDYAHGIFREPYMYGQDYNPMLEALLAAPFMRLGAHPWIVLPIVSTCIALMPFWSFALWHLRRREHIGALAFAAMPLLLPNGWDLSTTITRGIVQGLPFIACMPWLIGERGSPWRWCCAACCVSIGVLCNPNALVLAVFLYAPVLAATGRRAVFWAASILGVVPAAAYWWMGHRFFADSPWDIIHTIDPAELGFNIDLFFKAITLLDMHFKDVMPVWWPNGWLILIALGATVVLLWRSGKRSAAIGACAAMALMFYALGTEKAQNGCASAFFPASRLFMAAPLLLAACVAAIAARARITSRLRIPLMIGVIIFSIVKGYRFPQTLEHELGEQSCAMAPERPLSDVFARCLAIGDAARGSGAEVIAPIKWPEIRVDPRAHFRAYFDCYACSFILNDAPPVYGPGYDRRSWMRARFANSPAPRTLFVGGDPAGWARAMRARPAIIDLSDAQCQLHIVSPDTLTIEKLTVQLGADDDLWR